MTDQMSDLESPRPRPLSHSVSRHMSRMPTYNTTPELRLRKALHALGLRFRVQAKLPGRPDVAFTKARIAVFVDGCFWHLCPAHGTFPKNNGEWWRAKLERNVQRDRENDEHLRELGWAAVHVWEHEDPLDAAARIQKLWQQAVGAG